MRLRNPPPVFRRARPRGCTLLAAGLVGALLGACSDDTPAEEAKDAGSIDSGSADTGVAADTGAAGDTGPVESCEALVAGPWDLTLSLEMGNDLVYSELSVSQIGCRVLMTDSLNGFSVNGVLEEDGSYPATASIAGGGEGASFRAMLNARFEGGPPYDTLTITGGAVEIGDGGSVTGGSGTPSP